MKQLIIGIIVISLYVATATGTDAPDLVAGSYSYRMQADFPRFANEAINRDIRKWLDQALPSAKNYFSGFASSDLPEGGFEIVINHAVTKPTPTIASVRFTILCSPSGAAHPTTAVAVLNYDTVSGKRLALRDLFADPSMAMRIFSEHAPDLIQEEMEADGATWFENGFRPEADNYQSLGLEAGGVRVYFQQYQVLPYAYGMPTPLIPLELLRPAGPNPSIWPQK